MPSGVYERKFSKARSAANTREKNPSWKGGSSSYFVKDGKLTRIDEVYKELFEKQHGLCAICGKEETQKNNQGNGICKLHIDHNHKTGEVRGLLCGRCNRKLGFIEDIEFITKARLYLGEYGDIFDCSKIYKIVGRL